MKPLTKKVSSNNAMRSPVRPAPGNPTIQRRAPGGSTCRTPACGVSHSHGQNQQGAPSPSSSKAPSYRVHTPVPLGHGSQQIRATIQGSPQIAGSVELSKASDGKVYISNLRVDEQHRRRGVAAKLIDAAVHAARRQGFKAASLEARPSDNGISPQALVGMYRRQGFKSVGKSFRGSPMMERKL